MKYFRISKEKEQQDIEALIGKLRPILTPETVIVNCSPDYSSIICQQVIHAFYDNPVEMIPFQMPYPNSEFESRYPQYCEDFVNSLEKETKYIFIDSGVLRGRNFKTLADKIKPEMSTIFAALYVQDDAIFTPQIYLEKFSLKNDGMLLFYWENENCTLFGS
jgi:hypothetical protein